MPKKPKFPKAKVSIGADCNMPSIIRNDGVRDNCYPVVVIPFRSTKKAKTFCASINGLRTYTDGN